MAYGILATEPLTRSRDGYIAGVCEGLAKRFGIEPLWVRVAWILAVLCFGTGLLAYLAMWWIVPREGAAPVEPTVWTADASGQHRPPMRRTVRDRRILGVCGGLARSWGMDPSLVRLLTLALAMASFGAAVLVYLVLAVVMPADSALQTSGV